MVLPLKMQVFTVNLKCRRKIIITDTVLGTVLG